MRITVTYTYNGKEYKTLEDATLAAMANGLMKIMLERLEPIIDELNNANADIVIDVSKLLDDGSAQGTVRNVPEELKERAKMLLHKK